MKKIALGYVTFFFISIISLCINAQDIGPGVVPKVLLCPANEEESTLDVMYEMLINYRKNLRTGKETCSVAYYYRYSDGSDDGYRGMFAIYPLSTSGLKCRVYDEIDEDDIHFVFIDVSRGIRDDEEDLVIECGVSAW